MPLNASLSRAAINISASGDNTIVAGVAAQRVYVLRLFLWSNGIVNVQIKDGAGTNLTGAMALVAQSSQRYDFSDEPWFVTSNGNAFVINLSAAIQVSGVCHYVQIA